MIPRGNKCWTLTKRLEQLIAATYRKVIRMIQLGTRWNIK